MSDGDGGKKKKSGGSSGDEYGRAVARIAVAQICEGVGFQSSQRSALDALSEITVRYVRDLSKTAHFYGNLAGRTECNVLDVVQGLEDMVSQQGFAGASDVNRSFAGSGTLKEIMRYAEAEAEEVPFARNVARFPVVKEKKATPSFVQIRETPEGEHIPAWLPAFPDPHTYVHTPMWNERKTDPRADKIEQVRQRKKEEQALLSLQQRLACNGSSGFTSLKTMDDEKVKVDAAGSNTNANTNPNPFLAPPLQPGEKELEVSAVVPPSKISGEHIVNKPSSVLETFAPAMGAARAGVCESGDDDRRVLKTKRSVVNFKLGASKKSLGAPVDLSLQGRNFGETALLITRGNVKDDKKRRAEQILRESMDNSRELS